MCDGDVVGRHLRCGLGLVAAASTMVVVASDATVSALPTLTLTSLGIWYGGGIEGGSAPFCRLYWLLTYSWRSTFATSTIVVDKTLAVVGGVRFGNR